MSNGASDVEWGRMGMGLIDGQRQNSRESDEQGKGQRGYHRFLSSNSIAHLATTHNGNGSSTTTMVLK